MVFRNFPFIIVLAVAVTASQPAPAPPIPDVRQLAREVEERQKQLDKIRESYTYTAIETWQDLDSKGNVTKTETEEHYTFFVNGHQIERTTKKNDRPLSESEARKETERVTKAIEKAQKTAPDQPVAGFALNPTRVLELMDTSVPRLETYRGRPTIAFDFVGRKNAETHGVIENAIKRLKGTIWIDEADRQMARIEATFSDDFKVGGGLLASVRKGTCVHFDQGPVEGGLWLPTGAEATFAARFLLVRGKHQHFTEQDFDYKRFNVDTQQVKDATIISTKP
jgi:hypothetical protein